jgi:hypothetical protein
VRRRGKAALVLLLRHAVEQVLEAAAARAAEAAAETAAAAEATKLGEGQQRAAVSAAGRLTMSIVAPRSRGAVLV